MVDGRALHILLVDDDEVDVMNVQALRSTCVVVLTTSNEERDKVDAYELNVAGYLQKPVAFISFVEMTATLNKYWTLVEMS